MKKMICREHVWVLEALFCEDLDALFSEEVWVPMKVALTRREIREQKKGFDWPWLRIRKYYSEDIK
jgi:hypothetical protein